VRYEDIVPASREDAKGWRVITWALFGNDDGGLYGQYDEWGIFLLPEEMTWSVALRWWLRNPFHNMTHHVLRRERTVVRVVFERPEADYVSAPYWREPRNWVTESGPSVQLVRDPFFVSWRYKGWEGYLGWRESGELGAALRKSSRV